MGGKLENVLRLFLIFTVGVLISSRAWSEPKPVEMIVSLKTAKTVAVRQAPSPDAVAIAFVENGRPMFRKGSEETNGFVMVQLGDGRTGWTKSAFLAPISAPAALAAPQGIAAASAVNVPPAPQAAPASDGSASGKDMPAAGSLPELPVSASHVPTGVPREGALPTREYSVPAATKARTELWVVGLVGALGMLIGLVIGGKAGAVYATKSIHERYEVIN